MKLVSPVFVAWLVAVVGGQQKPGLVPEVVGGRGQTGEEWGTAVVWQQRTGLVAEAAGGRGHTVVVGILLVVAEGHSSHSGGGGGGEGLAVVATGLATLLPGDHKRIR